MARRGRARGWPLVLALLAGLAAVPAGAEAPATAAASPQDMRLIGYTLLTAGDAASALAIAEALVARDPADSAALMLRAQASQQLGHNGRARLDARAVWRQADTAPQRYGAALFLAQSLAADGYLNRGQFWLRRAAQDAEGTDETEILAAEFDRMRSRNPLRWSVALSVSPSSNVNSGSTADSFTNPGIPWLPPELEITGDQKALSGYEARAGVDLTWRLVPTATTMTAFHFGAEQRKVMLSGEAKDIAPGARGSDYDRASVEVGVTRRWRPEDSRSVYTFGGWLGHDWSGGESLSNSLRLEARAETPLGKRTVGMLAFSAEDQTRLDSDLRSARIAGVSLGFQHLLAGKDSLTFVLGLRDTATDSPGLRNLALSARLGWEKAEPVAGMGLTAWLTVESRDYPDSPYDPVDGRQDLRTALDVSVEFTEIQYMGFSPTLDLSLSRNRSDVGLYETRDLGIQFGFRSAF